MNKKLHNKHLDGAAGGGFGSFLKSAGSKAMEGAKQAYNSEIGQQISGQVKEAGTQAAGRLVGAGIGAAMKGIDIASNKVEQGVTNITGKMDSWG